MTRQQVRAFDAWAINEVGIAGIVLMENAGRSCAELIKEKLSGLQKPKVCIFCGTGNNGGDGYVVARHLLNSGFTLTVVICGDRNKIKGDARTNLDILERMGQSVELLNVRVPDIAGRVEGFAGDADMLVDGLFGTGLCGRLTDEYQHLIDGINQLQKPVLALDVPSGLDCDTAEPLGTAVRAAYTVTFAALKAGFTSAERAAVYTGQIFIASIGVEPEFSAG